MENVADVLTGGAGTESDELVVTFAGTGGATVIDLSSTSDQVQLFNGLANSAVQTGFEDVDLSSYTQTASIGADITGSSGANIVAGTTYADTVRLGAGNDTYVLDDLTTDTVDAGTGTNSLSIVAGVDVANTVDFGTYTNFDKIVANGSSDTAFSVTLKADADTDMSDMRTVDFSADTSTTGSNVIDLGLVSGTYDVTGGAGVETITGSLGADTIDGAAGADNITGGTGADTITGGTGSDVFLYATTGADAGITAATADTITDFALTTNAAGASEAIGDILDFAGTTAAIGSTTNDSNISAVTAGKITFVDSTLDLADLLTDAFTATNAADEAVFFVNGGDTYVVQQGDASEQVIILDGVTATSLLLNASVTATLAADQYVIA
jgi:Ca2+-binding RTX toxin-like protein